MVKRGGLSVSFLFVIYKISLNKFYCTFLKKVPKTWVSDSWSNGFDEVKNASLSCERSGLRLSPDPYKREIWTILPYTYQRYCVQSVRNAPCYYASAGKYILFMRRGVAPSPFHLSRYVYFASTQNAKVLPCDQRYQFFYNY